MPLKWLSELFSFFRCFYSLLTLYYTSTCISTIHSSIFLPLRFFKSFFTLFSASTPFSDFSAMSYRTQIATKFEDGQNACDGRGSIAGVIAVKSPVVHTARFVVAVRSPKKSHPKSQLKSRRVNGP